MKQHIYTFSERRERKNLCVPFRDDMRQKLIAQEQFPVTK